MCIYAWCKDLLIIKTRSFQLYITCVSPATALSLFSLSWMGLLPATRCNQPPVPYTLFSHSTGGAGDAENHVNAGALIGMTTNDAGNCQHIQQLKLRRRHQIESNASLHLARLMGNQLSVYENKIFPGLTKAFVIFGSKQAFKLVSSRLLTDLNSCRGTALEAQQFIAERSRWRDFFIAPQEG